MGPGGLLAGPFGPDFPQVRTLLIRKVGGVVGFVAVEERVLICHYLS